jgi:hypothetical protein
MILLGGLLIIYGIIEYNRNATVSAIVLCGVGMYLVGLG